MRAKALSVLDMQTCPPLWAMALSDSAVRIACNKTRSSTIWRWIEEWQKGNQEKPRLRWCSWGNRCRWIPECLRFPPSRRTWETVAMIQHVRWKTQHDRLKGRSPQEDQDPPHILYIQARRKNRRLRNIGKAKRTKKIPHVGWKEAKKQIGMRMNSRMKAKTIKKKEEEAEDEKSKEEEEENVKGEREERGRANKAQTTKTPDITPSLGRSSPFFWSDCSWSIPESRRQGKKKKGTQQRSAEELKTSKANQQHFELLLLLVQFLHHHLLIQLHPASTKWAALDHCPSSSFSWVKSKLAHELKTQEMKAEEEEVVHSFWNDWDQFVRNFFSYMKQLLLLFFLLLLLFPLLPLWHELSLSKRNEKWRSPSCLCASLVFFTSSCIALLFVLTIASFYSSCTNQHHLSSSTTLILMLNCTPFCLDNCFILFFFH